MLRSLRWLRFLLVWPIVSAYRRRARRSLRWRLAGYNLLTLIGGLTTALILVGLLAAVGASARRYADEEPAEDAKVVAEFLASTSLVTSQAPVGEELEPVLGALMGGQVPLYRGPGQDQFDTRPRQFLKGVSAITVLGVDGQVIHAGAFKQLGIGIEDVVASAQMGEADLRTNSTLAGDAGAGAFPIFIGDGAIAGVVVVEKSEIQAPQGGAILRAQIRPVVTTVWVGSVVAAVPGLAVAVLLAVAAARSVGGRIRAVSSAAEGLAAGALDARVPVRGEDEVASLSRSFNTMAERLQETMGSLDTERQRAVALLDGNRQLVANVSHELRTPVAIIRGQVEALDEDAPGNERIDAALRELDRLEQLVSDLFELATVEAGARSEAPGEVDLGLVIREAATPLIEVAWREAQVRIIVETPEQPLGALAVGERLAGLVQNLLRNAITHTPEGGLVRIACALSESVPTITVSDTGAGIALEDLPHVFERFYRGDASRRRATGGAGLGLAIAREFVEAMGGAISVESAPGEGATFTIVLSPPA